MRADQNHPEGSGGAGRPLEELHLVVFSRAPEPGRTKTRLIPALGEREAARFHAACLNTTLEVVERWRNQLSQSGRPVPRGHLYITPPGSQPLFRQAGVRWPHGWAWRNQRGENLGQRMAAAIADVWCGGKGKTERRPGVIIVGSDLPLLEETHLEAAARMLETRDAVFGPCPDGGYYLVGSRVNEPGLFDLQTWGGSEVLTGTLEAAGRLGLSCGLIESLPDVDTAEDIRQVLSHPLAERLSSRPALELLRKYRAS